MSVFVDVPVPAAWFAPPSPVYATVHARSASAIPVRSAPGGRSVTWVRAHTPYGSRTRLWVRAQHGRWLKVSVFDAPGSVGWIDRSRTTPGKAIRHEIVIDRSRRRLTLVGPSRSWSVRVILGRSATRTPTGRFQVTDRLPGRRFGGIYGHRVLVLSSFGPGTIAGRLAIHGMPPGADPAGSAGCIRVPREALERLAAQAPPGTPVRIVS